MSRNVSALALSVTSAASSLARAPPSSIAIAPSSSISNFAIPSKPFPPSFSFNASTAAATPHRSIIKSSANMLEIPRLVPNMRSRMANRCPTIQLCPDGNFTRGFSYCAPSFSVARAQNLTHSDDLYQKHYRTRLHSGQLPCWRRKKSVFCGSLGQMKWWTLLLKRAQNAQNRLEHGLAAEHFAAVIELAPEFSPAWSGAGPAPVGVWIYTVLHCLIWKMRVVP